MSKVRIAVSFLAIGAVAFVAQLNREGFTEKAVIPIKGDRPTYGFGSTVKADGSDVTMTDRITAQQAVKLVQRDIAAKEGRLKQCFGDVVLYQHEYDAFVRLSYNVGPDAICNSKIPSQLQAGDYDAACRNILSFKHAQNKDCSIQANNCMGVWNSRVEEYKMCRGDIQ